MLPCAMIVVLSWVGFWIDYRATPARASLAITTVLTITSLTNSIRMSLPNVAYTKSIDVYLLTCFFFVFASTVEFAVAGVTDKKWLKSHKKRKSRAEVSPPPPKKNYVYFTTSETFAYRPATCPIPQSFRCCLVTESSVCFITFLLRHWSNACKEFILLKWLCCQCRLKLCQCKRVLLFAYFVGE